MGGEGWGEGENPAGLGPPHPDPPPHELTDMKQLVHKRLPRQVHGGRERTKHKNSCATSEECNFKTHASGYDVLAMQQLDFLCKAGSASK
jgi:hypothetical protein